MSSAVEFTADSRKLYLSLLYSVFCFSALLQLSLGARESNDSLVQGPLTEHFQDWLRLNGYAAFDLARNDIPNGFGSYGGKSYAKHRLHHQPIIFVQPMGQAALQTWSGRRTGWSSTMAYLQRRRRYSSAELYTTTVGLGRRANGLGVSGFEQNCTELTRLRRFVEAVGAYTKTRWLDVVAHSAAVTVARKCLKGGAFTDKDGSICNLGPPLTDLVDTFLGIAGGNFGSCNCFKDGLKDAPVCGTAVGYYAGLCDSQPPEKCAEASCQATGESEFLKNLNSDPTREAQHVFSFRSTDDAAWKPVWGRKSSEIPGQDGERVFENLSHMNVKASTAEEQFRALVYHEL